MDEFAKNRFGSCLGNLPIRVEKIRMSRRIVTLSINHVMSNKKSKIYFKLSMGLPSEVETVYNPETIRWLNPILDDENLEEERILAYKEKRRERYKNSTPVRS